MDQGLREVVRRRAGDACEYCRLAQQATPLIAFHVEHIVSRQHGGGDDTAAIASALGLSGPNVGMGVPVGSSTPCDLGTAGCYDSVVTITNDPSTPLYYDNLGERSLRMPTIFTLLWNTRPTQCSERLHVLVRVAEPFPTDVMVLAPVLPRLSISSVIPRREI